MTPDKATENFIKLRDSNLKIKGENWTESDTRSKFIDTILKDCLCWSEIDIRRELSSDNKRLDYLLSTNRPYMVVEAKKADIELKVPRKQGVYKIKLQSLIVGNPSLKPHIDQVTEYCREWSVPVAVLTNGSIYIIFMAIRNDGIKFLNGIAIVIQDIYDKTFNFSDLYNHLSRDLVFDSTLINALLATEKIERPESPSSTIPNYDGLKGCNPIGLALQPLLEQVFKDVSQEDSSEVLEHCYVPPGSSVLRNEEFEALLIDKPPSFAQSANIISVDTKKTYEKFQESIKSYLQRQKKGQTLLVTGSVGVGKTMFLLRYFKLNLSSNKTIEDETLAFYIDFRRPNIDPGKIPDLIYSKIRHAIESLDGQEVVGEKKQTKYDLLSSEGLEQIFWPEIQKLQKAFDKRLLEAEPLLWLKSKQEKISELNRSDEFFVRGAIRVLKDRYHRYICVILDNADQCDSTYQEAVYLFSRTLEDQLQCIIITALREEWYWYFGFGKKDGPFSAYHDTVYHIIPPRSRDVLAKRLKYSIELIKENKTHCSIEVSLDNNTILEAKHLLKYLSICEKAFTENEEITTFFECTSNGSVRTGLKTFLEFLRSGHTHVDEYLKAFIENDNYTLKFHQVFKSIALTQYNYYSSKRSIISNIFIPVFDKNFNHMSYFTKIYLLDWLSNCRNLSNTNGFKSMGEIKTFLENMGIPEAIQRDILTDLLRTDLIEPDIRRYKEIEEWRYIRITCLGAYTIKHLSGKFCYLETIMLETPIKNVNDRNIISKPYQNENKPLLNERIKAVQRFILYLKSEEMMERVRLETANIQNICSPIMPTIQTKIDEEIKAIQESNAWEQQNY